MKFKSLITGLFAVSLLTGAAYMPAAHAAVGEWTVYSVFNGSPENIVETKDKVYYQISECLYSYDKNGNETYSYSTVNKLNDNSIKNIYYSPADKVLAIAYESSNIDLLYDNGRVVNLSDIVDANISTTKAINDISFANGRMYVATDFGFVVFDLAKHNVVESANYKTKIGAIAVVGDRLTIYDANSNMVKQAPLADRHVTMDGFTNILNTSAQWIVPISETVFIIKDNSNNLVKCTVVNPGTFGIDVADKFATGVKSRMHLNKDGQYYFQNTSALVSLDANGAIGTTTALPAVLASQLVTVYDGSSFWGADNDGLASYTVSGETATVTSRKAKPGGTTTVKYAAYMAKSSDGNKIYISNIGYNFRLIDFGTNWKKEVQTTNYVDESGVIHDASVLNASADKWESQQEQKNNNNTRMYGGPQRIAVDPQNSNRYYIGSFLEGVYIVEYNEKTGLFEEIGKFDTRNMPTVIAWGGSDKGAHSFDVNFDPEGNLWVGNFNNYDDDYRAVSPYVMLPKEKLYTDLKTITRNDWKQSKAKGVNGIAFDARSVFSKSGAMFNWDYRFANAVRLYVTITNGNWSNPEQHQYRPITNFTDQDGNTFQPDYWYCGIEDKRGRIWMGTDRGVVEFTNPANTLNPDFRIKRLKVPRNDGTNYADYLLDAIWVTDIACDSSNRKWIATYTSGLYLVSENGDQILEHFTAENSPLPSNCIYTVACHDKNNMVYIGTSKGIVSYSSTSAPAADSYDEVYAYPNTVRPDYTGWITIKGLMDNSLVKIADAAGNVFHQGRSDGGMYVWDGCNANGERVRSGVYYVFASQNENEQSSGAVTKILVVN